MREIIASLLGEVSSRGPSVGDVGGDHCIFGGDDENWFDGGRV